jgi:hypothetical protein
MVFFGVLDWNPTPNIESRIIFGEYSLTIPENFGSMPDTCT